MYNCASKTLSSFIHRLMANYLSRGYFFYVTGKIPLYKNPTETDRKIIMQYGIEVSKWARARARKRGEASIQYHRYAENFVILATKGKHRFLTEEAHGLRDIRLEPLRVGGCVISYQWRATGTNFFVRRAKH